MCVNVLGVRKCPEKSADHMTFLLRWRLWRQQVGTMEAAARDFGVDVGRIREWCETPATLINTGLDEAPVSFKCWVFVMMDRKCYWYGKSVAATSARKQKQIRGLFELWAKEVCFCYTQLLLERVKFFIDLNSLRHGYLWFNVTVSDVMWNLLGHSGWWVANGSHCDSTLFVLLIEL